MSLLTLQSVGTIDIGLLCVHLSLVHQDKISSGTRLLLFQGKNFTNPWWRKSQVFFALELHLSPASRKNLASETWIHDVEERSLKTWPLGSLVWCPLGCSSSPRIRPPCSSSSPSRQGWTRQILLGKESWGQFIALRLQSWLRMHYCIACISVNIKVPGHDINFFRSTRKSSKPL